MAKDINKLLEKYESENEDNDVGDEDAEDERDLEIEEKSTNEKLEGNDNQGAEDNKKIKLDLKDRKILYQLDLNSRQPNSEIAKKVGLSKEVVNYRIKRLESEKIIRGYYAIIDLSKLGYLNFRVYLRLIDSSPKKEKEIIDFLVRCKETSHVADIDGPFDLAFGVSVKEIHEFESFYNKFKNNFKQFIGKEQISIFTAVYHFNRNYLSDEKSPRNSALVIGKSHRENYDETDLKILDILSKNSRRPLIEISENLSIPERTISFRIKKLEQKKIILGYKPLLDLNLLGYEYFKLDVMLKDTSRIKILMAYIESNRFVTYVDQTIGGSDFEFDLEVKDKKQFLEIIDDLRTKFPEIREWNYFTLKRYNKLLYFPIT